MSSIISSGIELPWPTEFADYEEKLKTEWGLSHLRFYKALAGKSGAIVHLSHIQYQDTSKNGVFGILKLEKKERRADVPAESENLNLARKNSGKFAEDHFPTLMYEYADENVTAYLFSIVADGLEYISPLGQLTGQTESLVKFISAGIMEWNAIGHSQSADTASAQKLLSEWLGYRINAEQGGNIPAFFKKCGIDATDESFSVAGQVFPNPLFFCKQTTDEITKSAPIYPLYGQQHGDCHGNNILVRQDFSEALNTSYFLIDFSLYREKAPLFYDHAYLELNYLLESFSMADEKRWEAVVTSCGKRAYQADKSVLQRGDTELIKICRDIRLEVDGWIVKNHSKIKPSAEKQQLLAHVAVGLNFANKAKLEINLRYLAAIYAAHHLREYYKFNSVEPPSAGKPLCVPAKDGVSVSKTSESNAWREMWLQFNNDHIYLLVVGKGLHCSSEELASLGKLPWSMVLDLNSSSMKDGVQAAAVGEIKKRRGYHLLFPEQAVDINFDEGTLWMMVAGSVDQPDTLPRDFDEWRFGTLKKIGTALSTLRSKTRPKILKAIFLVSDETDKRYFELVADRIEEEFHQCKPELVFCTQTKIAPLSETSSRKNVSCTPLEWIRGMHLHMGSVEETDLVYLPYRVLREEAKEIVREPRGFKRDVDLLNLNEDLEIVHSGLEADRAKGAVGDFLRGNTISWMELGRGYDVKLEMYDGFKAEVLKLLGEYSNETVELSHNPGAGGTTVARRLAWDLHMLFPCVVLRKNSDSTAGRIATLYRITGLPVLVIIEAATMSVSERDRLYKAVHSDKARAVFIYVSRAYGKGQNVKIAAPLSPPEAQRFFNKYSAGDAQRKESLRKLVSNDNMLPYRLPFFFGLFAFEREFKNVDSYVRAYLLSASAGDARNLLCYVALTSFYSQTAIGFNAMAALCGKSDADSFSIDAVLGGSLGRLAVIDNRGGKLEVRIAHPVLAEEILKQSLSNSNTNHVAWSLNLDRLSCEFIEKLAITCGSDSDEALQLLEQLFIQREPWSDSSESRRKNFSQLINSISSDSGQAHVLEKLTTLFPGEAHFWNHRGRHSNLVMKDQCEQSEKYLLKAIQLSPKDPLHYHSLGMIYRMEINRLLKRKESASQHQKVSVDDTYNEIARLFSMAEDAFASARNLEPDNEYSYVSNIQLILDTIEKLYGISKFKSYSEFFTGSATISIWLRSLLEKAKELLDEVIRMKGREGKGRYVETCLSRYKGLMGDYEAMISGFNAMLSNGGDERPLLRRLIADFICTHHGSDWSQLSGKNLKRIYELANENIQSGTASHRDYLNWFQAYRRIPGFNFNEAISTMDMWALNGEAVDAHYYLFALYFIKWHQGLSTDISLARQNLEKTRRASGGRNWSHEWMSKQEKYACGLVHHNDLGTWGNKTDGHPFFNNLEPLLRVRGVITKIKDAKSGEISIYQSTAPSQEVRNTGRMDAFFIPGIDFISGRDENTYVSAYIGFSYEGLRAWIVRRA